jgi:sulfate adenylyltransferase
MNELHLNRNQYLELEKICVGAFFPVSGFMNAAELRSVTETMRLPSGEAFPVPVVLDLNDEQARDIRKSGKVSLVFNDIEVGSLHPEEVYTPDKRTIAQAVFGTRDQAHPGVAHLYSMGAAFVGGRVKLTSRADLDISRFELTPSETRALFTQRGWKSVVGFQTRNVPHRAHEYLLRVALESSDGLFVEPLVGRKKAGDYTPEAIMRAYQRLLGDFFPQHRVALGILSTAMRYAGPREAVFHAIVRRNYGCTKFVVGRDHAGVGDYYGLYDAHALIRRFEGELGIEVLCLNGPYHCRKCDGIVTDRTCPHRDTAPDCVQDISGTDMRAILVGGDKPNPHLMRPEIVDCLDGVPLFVTESDL